MHEEITWRPRGPIRVPAPASTPEPRTPATPPHILDLIACPTCHCKAGEVCKTPAGNAARRAHSTRLVARFCACGAILPRYRKAWCETCYVKALRKAQREYNARRRAAQREARRAA